MPDDIRVSATMTSHPKLLKLERRRGIVACWSLLKLWLWICDNRPDGNLAGLTDEDLELAVGWKSSESLIPVLADLRFLDGESGSYIAHEWETHQPWVATRDQRVQKARRAGLARWQGTTPEERAAQARAAADARWTLGDASGGHESSKHDVEQAACIEHASCMPSSPLLATPTLTSTPTKNATAAAFSAIGHDEPFGHARFQRKFVKHFSERGKDEWLTIVMERTIQECQRNKIGIPKPFYDAKRDVEVRENAEAMPTYRSPPL